MPCSQWLLAALVVVARGAREQHDMALRHEFLEGAFKAGSISAQPSQWTAPANMEQAIMGNGAPPGMVQDPPDSPSAYQAEAVMMGNGAPPPPPPLAPTDDSGPPADASLLAQQLRENDSSLNMEQMSMMQPPTLDTMPSYGSAVGVKPMAPPPADLNEMMESPGPASPGGHPQALLAEHAVQGAPDPPASFWAWKTTAAPPPPPGPNPQVMWVAQTAGPFPTTPPIYENCYGCDCLLAYDTDIVQGGSIPDKYTCFGGAPTVHVPQFKWAGTPKNTGLDHEVKQPDGTSCMKSQSFAITMQDMDFPYGVGQSKNSIRKMFWAVNIPGDWTEFNEELAHATYKDLPVVVVGRNDGGKFGMEVPCPKYGVHRYMFTLWALKSYLGTELNPVDPNTDFNAILPLLEEKELSRFTFYGTVAAQGDDRSFLQKATQEATKKWFER